MSEERKLVTILFADVTSSTALGDMLDPEDVRALMGRYYNHARRIITTYGGTLEKFIGDAVMAVFGLPQIHSDDAERGLAAALALRETIANDEVLAPSFSLRIGINTGEVVATSDTASPDFLVTGDAVNVAARLQQCANPGEIVVGERTASAARTAFLFSEPRSLEVRGKRLPLQVYSLECKRSARKVERPPFVGRRQDLLQLALLQARTLEEQRPQLATIIAPAGTGKTRLIEEFLSRLDPADGFQVATVRCLSYGQTLTYWPLRGLLTGLLGEDISRERITRVFVENGYQPNCSNEYAEFILAALGVEGERAMVDRESVFAAWRLLIEVLARQAPRIIIFEDLHWASDSLLDMVEYIIHLRTQASLLLITLSRPELLDRRPSWGGGRQNFTTLALQPLTPKQTHDLVARLAQDMPENLRTTIVERSGGNPFFALELVRGVSERGSLNADTAHPLPDTVHAAVLARLDLLSPVERRVLQVASIANRTFRSSMLDAVLDEYSMQEIDDAIDVLLMRDLIVAPDADNFAFRHMLIRDVTSGTLSRQERIRLHGKIATWLETRAGSGMNEYVELIAYHYREAVLLSRQSAIPLQLSIDPTRAIRFLQRAGELASRAGAFVEARKHLQSAIDIAPESQHQMLYEQLGDCLTWGEIATQAYKKALEHWRASKEQNPLVGARLLRKLLICYTRGADKKVPSVEELAAMRAEARQLAQVAGDEDEQWRIRVVDLFIQSCPDTDFPGIDTRREIGLEAADYFERKGNWTAFSEALDGYASIAMHQGAYQDALKALQRRLKVDLPALERGDGIQMIARAYTNMSEYDACISFIREQLAQARPGQPLSYLGSGISQAVSAAFITGRWSVISEFIPILEEIVEESQFDVVSHVHKGYIVLLQLATAREDQPAIDAAASVIQRLFPDDNGMTRQLADALVTDDPNRIDLDVEHSNPVLLFYNEHGLPVSEKLLERMCSYHWQADLTDRGIEISRALAANDDERLVRAIDAAEEYQMVVHAARMRIVLGQRTGDKSQLDRARPVLERLEDRQFLRRLEEVASALKAGSRS